MYYGAKLYTDLAATIEAKPGDPVAVIIQDELPAFMQESPEHRPVLTTPGADLAAQRRRATKVCPACGKTFTARATARVCSSTCRSRLHRQKKEPK